MLQRRLPRRAAGRRALRRAPAPEEHGLAAGTAVPCAGRAGPGGGPPPAAVVRRRPRGAAGAGRRPRAAGAEPGPRAPRGWGKGGAARPGPALLLLSSLRLLGGGSGWAGAGRRSVRHASRPAVRRCAMGPDPGWTALVLLFAASLLTVAAWLLQYWRSAALRAPPRRRTPAAEEAGARALLAALLALRSLREQWQRAWVRALNSQARRHGVRRGAGGGTRAGWAGRRVGGELEDGGAGVITVRQGRVLSLWSTGAATPLSSGSEETSVNGLPVRDPVAWAEMCWQTLSVPASPFGLLCVAVFCT